MHIQDKISIKPFPGLRLKTFSVLFLLSTLVVQKLYAQVTDDFSDGNFTTNPAWYGTVNTFIVNTASQLQLNSPVAGVSYLYTDLRESPMGNIEWEVFAKQSFAPSSANFGRFYLASDQQELSQPLNGYFLQFGEAGSNDAVELFRQSGTATVSVCRATEGGIASSFAIRVKVTRDSEGFWQLFVDYTGETNFILEASGTDNSHTSTVCSGILCTYTITNAARFYYDDISIQSRTAPDTRPPQIVSLEVTSSQSLRLVFSEDLHRATAENLLNYYASPSPGNPTSAMLNENGNTVDLSFSDPFLNGYESEIIIQGIADSRGNLMAKTGMTFLYFEPGPVHFKDVIITELCADPSPQVGLPEAEFVEVFNRSETPIDLSGWTLADETISAQLGSFILLPDHYLILASASTGEKFSSFGDVLPLSPFPSLNNSGDILTLKDPDTRIIDSVKYQTTWYRDDEKADGGWSMELIDPQNICAEKNNWVASEANAGGTPGNQNSVYANMPDNTGPKVISVVPLDRVSLLIAFDEKLDDILPSADQFIFEPPLGVRSIAFADASLTLVTLFLSEEVESGRIYGFRVVDIYDCPGNKILEAFSQAVFVLPEKAQPGDIIVNEILFNPRPTGIDFVEIYNRSGKTIDLKNWSIRNFSSAAGNNSSNISPGDLLIFPNQFKVFTENANILKGEYLMGVEQNFSEINLPAFNDDLGSVVLVDNDNTLIDSMQYTDKMQGPFINDAEGISLERISLNLESDASSNWRSASSTSGFATPGYVNSNVRPDVLVHDGSVIVEPEILHPYISPGDFAQIKYRFDRGGFIANVKIIDQQGRAIRQIAHNELLGTEGFYRWDGDRDNGLQARTGYYMVWFEIFDTNGTLKTYKKRVAVYR